MKITGLILLFVNLTTYAQVKDCKILYQTPEKESAYPHLSKTGKNILYQSNESGKWQIMIMDLEKGTPKNLSNDTLNNNFPDWSPDNKLIAFVSDRDGNENIYLMKSDGSEIKKIIDDNARDIHPYFSPDGKYILFSSTRGNGS